MLVGEEAFHPYQRPPLSKAYLAGDLTADRLLVKPEAFYGDQSVEVRLSTKALSLNRSEKCLQLSGDTKLTYDKLILATGARVRKLSIPGADLPGVGYVRTIDDVHGLQSRFAEGARMVVVGAGYIGLEVAAVAAQRGLNVTVLEVADRVMARVTSPTVSAFYQALHAEHGVDIRLSTGIDAFEAGEGGDLAAAVTATGERMPCEIAVVGIGVIPNAELADEAGLSVDDGIVVNEVCQTEDPAIYAIGDCTRHPSRYFGGKLRLESVHNALEQAKTAAAAICGAPVAYDQVPWFWSDQYDVKLQTVGLSAGRADREVLRGEPAEKAFSVFYFADEKLIAVDSLNRPADHMISRQLLAHNIPLSDEQVRDPAFDLKSLLKR